MAAAIVEESLRIFKVLARRQRPQPLPEDCFVPDDCCSPYPSIHAEEDSEGRVE